MRVETRFVLNGSEGAKEHCSAGPARPVSSPAASLTAGQRFPQRVLGLDALIGLYLWNPVAGNLPHGERNGIPTDRRRNNQQGRLAAPEGG